ncbi:hypothetical protein [Mucilaginibacter celer]|uniref:Uncharacterized protein n=1 Tax=Mucilaginibacter celer TaxID=2305508 RepID=A0A494VYV7_9SPHI|nr:hypothetical protein [Mucilaginibacter celer]AYL96693.1 hypothetical protein HYN43_015915 [Mucilaginibacter celer]
MKAAPPNKKKIIIPIVLIVIGLFLMKQGELWALVIAGFGGYLFYAYFNYNRNVYPRLYADWEKSWLCNKCGAIYLQ